MMGDDPPACIENMLYRFLLKMAALQRRQLDGSNGVAYEEDEIARMRASLLGAELEEDGKTWRVLEVGFDAEHEQAVLPLSTRRECDYRRLRVLVCVGSRGVVRCDLPEERYRDGGSRAGLLASLPRHSRRAPPFCLFFPARRFFSL